MKARLLMTVPMFTLLAGGAFAASPAEAPRMILAQSGTTQQDTQRSDTRQQGTQGTTMQRSGAQGMAGGTQVSEACMQALDEVRQKTADRGYGVGGRDLGTLYDAAMVFGRNGQDEACQDVVDGMREYSEAQADLTDEQRAAYERDLQNARPIGQVGNLRASDLIGREVVGMNGDSLGDVDDVVISGDGKVQHILIGTGGFLGLGEQQVPVNMKQVRMAGEDRLVLNVDADRFENAPRYDRADLEGNDGSWWNESDSWWDENARTAR